MMFCSTTVKTVTTQILCNRGTEQIKNKESFVVQNAITNLYKECILCLETTRVDRPE